jgi:pimeloyl-ACP methyl ester carboxylesterase
MSSKVICLELSVPWFQVNALAFIPSPDKTPIKSEWALFSHGYTSHKGDCLNWATRLVEAGVPCMIFDQPGHYLGSFHEIASFEDFKEHAHELFAEGLVRLQGLLEQQLGFGQFPANTGVILGGHSLGAYTSIKALELPAFAQLNRVAVAVGIGIGQRQATHLFETAFYEKTLSIRRQLVSPQLDSKEVFAWLKDAKENMVLSNQRIHMITGEDDIVVGNLGMEVFQEVLEKQGNVVTTEKPKRLPHHEPALATAHIYSFLKNHFGWI